LLHHSSVRLFVAIELTAPARAAIAAEQRRIAEAATGTRFRLVPAERLHVTVAFIGEVSEARGADILAVMREDVEQAPFELEFAGVGVFPPHGSPRVLWLGLGAGASEILHLRDQIVQRLAAADMELRDRFSPHLTLGRWRGGRPSDRPRSLRAGSVARMPVEYVTAFQSRLSSSGPTYVPLARARLAHR
jgi:2'-5' RNA ligase